MNRRPRMNMKLVKWITISFMCICAIATILWISHETLNEKESATPSTEVVTNDEIEESLLDENQEGEPEAPIIEEAVYNKPDGWEDYLVAKINGTLEEEEPEEPEESQQQQTTTTPSTPPSAGNNYTGTSASTLFIGDSRTEGIRLYCSFSNVAYFSDTGASATSIWNKTVNGMTLEQTLQNGNYSNICILFGINEIGGDLNYVYQGIANTVSKVQAYQPNARIFVQANLHVTASKHAEGTVFNNTRINQLNALISNLHNGSNIIYLDANPIFDDGAGNLGESWAPNDGIHFGPTGYKTWGQWLIEQMQ